MNKIIKQQDDIDLLNAIKDGRTFSCNTSPTCRAKIIGLRGVFSSMLLCENDRKS